MQVPFSIIDLTYPINEKIPTWSGDKGHELRILSDYTDFKDDNKFRTHEFKCFAGIGTHIDAPAHIIIGGRTVDQLKMSELSAECIVLDVSHEATEGYLIGPDAIERWEKEHGEIPAASFVIFYTGWGRNWSTPEKYRNEYNFPALSPSTAEMLVERGVAGVGIDTLSFDTGKNGFPAHKALLEKDKYLIENIANVHLLPYTGAHTIVMPMYIEGATEAPVRLIALL